MARAIGVDGNRVIGHFEQPRLCVVRTGGKNGAAKRSLVSVLLAASPLVPRHVRGPRRTGEHTAIPRTIANRRKANRRKGNGCASNNDCLALHRKRIVAENREEVTTRRAASGATMEPEALQVLG